jgi:hypothetical protein
MTRQPSYYELELECRKLRDEITRMRTTGDLFAQPSGTELRDAGIDRAAAAASRQVSNFKERAVAAIREYAEAHRTLTCEDVRLHAEAHGFPVVKGQGWAGVMRSCKFIEHTGTFAKAKNPLAHCATKGVWRSLIYRPGILHDQLT